MQLFGTRRLKFLHCPRTKGQRDKLKILPRAGTGRDSLIKIRDGRQDGTITIFLSKLGTVLEHRFPVLEHPFPLLEHLFPVFCFWWESEFVPGHPGIEEFFPRFLLLPLSRDKGTTGQRNIFVLGRPLETLVCTRG